MSRKRKCAGATGCSTRARPNCFSRIAASEEGNVRSASLFRSLPFDPLKSFAPVAMMGGFAIALFVAQRSGYRTLADLLEQARARPGRLNLGSIAVGSTQHLSAELFKTRAGIDAQVVPYNGTPALITAIRAGDIDAAFEIVGPLLAQLRSGALRALAVSSRARSAALPEVATVGQSGVDDYDVVSWNGLSAPAGTPPAIVARLAGAVETALATTPVRDALRQLGVEPIHVGTGHVSHLPDATALRGLLIDDTDLSSQHGGLDLGNGGLVYVAHRPGLQGLDLGYSRAADGRR